MMEATSSQAVLSMTAMVSKMRIPLCTCFVVLSVLFFPFPFHLAKPIPRLIPTRVMVLAGALYCIYGVLVVGDSSGIAYPVLLANQLVYNQWPTSSLTQASMSDPVDLIAVTDNNTAEPG